MVGVELSLFEDNGGDRSFEDDGAWHLARYGLRAVFNVYSDSCKIQNDRVRALMARFRLKPEPADLLDESDALDDDDCPHCGR